MAITQVETHGPSNAGVVAAAFRDELLEKSTARGRASVERIWTVCQELIAAGKPITVAEVGRITEKRWGGPKAQGIRDQPDRLKRLVDLSATILKEAEGNYPGRNSKAATKVDALVAEVGDQTVRARIRAIVEERDQLRRDLQTLRKAYQRLTPIKDLTPEQCYREIPAPSAAQASSDVAPLLAPAQTFTQVEKLAARQFLDEGFLYDEGLKVDEVQGLVTADGRIVLPAAFITALRKIAD